MFHETLSQLRMSPVGIAVPDLLHGSYEVFAVASARYYHAQLGSKPPAWEYSKYRGILVFGKTNALENETHSAEVTTQDHSKNIENYWFKLLISKSGETKTVWSFKVFNDLNYKVDKPFFHVIDGLTRRYGFLFDDDDAAMTFSQKVHENYIPPVPERFGFSPGRGIKFRSKSHPVKSGSKKRDKTSMPVVDSLRHAVHIGMNKLGVLESRGPKASEPTWETVLGTYHSSKSSSYHAPSDHIGTSVHVKLVESDDTTDSDGTSEPQANPNSSAL